MEIQKLYTPREAAKIFNVRAETVREWVRRGQVEAIKLPGGTGTRIPESEILRIAGQTWPKVITNAAGQVLVLSETKEAGQDETGE